MPSQRLPGVRGQSFRENFERHRDEMENNNRTDAVNPASETPQTEVPADEHARLIAECDRLKQERDELEERWLRLRAEFDNFRKRVQREQGEILERAAMETVRSLLPVLDDFERALKAPTADATYAKGMELIYQRLLDILLKAGLEPVDTAGKQFDPHVHEAVDMVPTGEAEENTVFEEFRKGYNFRGKLLRPAMVRVAVKPSGTSEDTVE